LARLKTLCYSLLETVGNSILTDAVLPGILLIHRRNSVSKCNFSLDMPYGTFLLCDTLSGGEAVDWGSARLSEPGSNAANVFEEVPMAAKKKASKAKKKAPAKKGAAKKKK
jgi:hypothetical protein